MFLRNNIKKCAYKVSEGVVVRLRAVAIASFVWIKLRNLRNSGAGCFVQARALSTDVPECQASVCNCSPSVLCTVSSRACLTRPFSIQRRTDFCPAHVMTILLLCMGHSSSGAQQHRLARARKVPELDSDGLHATQSDSHGGNGPTWDLA